MPSRRTKFAVEIVGQQLRIRVDAPAKFCDIKTDNVGKPGRLQRIAGQRCNDNQWGTQSWRLNLNDYKDINDVKQELERLKHDKQITPDHFIKAITLLRLHDNALLIGKKR